MILSTPEGADKPAEYPLMFQESAVMIINKAEYPLMFQESAVMIINKMDLMPYVDFDLQKAKRTALAINPNLQIFDVSCRNGEGLEGWFNWLSAHIEAFRTP